MQRNSKFNDEMENTTNLDEYNSDDNIKLLLEKLKITEDRMTVTEKNQAAANKRQDAIDEKQTVIEAKQKKYSNFYHKTQKNVKNLKCFWVNMIFPVEQALFIF